MRKLLKNSLEHKTDIQLVRAVKNKASSEAFIEICRRYQDVFYRQCQKYATPLYANGIFLKDIFDEKDIVIFNCIKTYDPKKGAKLSSWIGNYARYLCLNSMNSRKFIASSSDEEVQKLIEDSQVSQSHSQRHENLSEYRDYVFDLLGQLKDERVKDIFNYRYFSSKKMIWNDIAKKVKTSPQTVMSLHKKGLILIRKKMNSTENICDIV